MPKSDSFSILPYSLLVGQGRLKLALELAFIDPGIGGVLLSGHRGTAKSTAVRAFARMAYGDLPVTIPINATDDRVVGGWKVKDLMEGKATPQRGLLLLAREKILYIDEVNLLDDHLVNLILDAASTGVLELQREGLAQRPQSVTFTLVGTMNPEEGSLRPQLLDRFGLFVDVEGERTKEERLAILETVLKFEDALARLRRKEPAPSLEAADKEDGRCRDLLQRARGVLRDVEVPPRVKECCAELGSSFDVEGHRAERVMALAARACAALRHARGNPGKGKKPKAAVADVKAVARLALQHRRRNAFQGDRIPWSPDDEQKVQALS
jgi:magnesium chelatase subunit I